MCHLLVVYNPAIYVRTCPSTDTQTKIRPKKRGTKYLFLFLLFYIFYNLYNVI